MCSKISLLKYKSGELPDLYCTVVLPGLIPAVYVLGNWRSKFETG